MGLGSLIGGIGGIISGVGANKAAKDQNKLNREALETQKAAAKPLQELYTDVGQPGYISAIKGLLSSFGFRPASQGVAGTSLGSTTTGQPEKPINFEGEWGYNPNLGQTMGVTTDQYQQAEQQILNRDDLSPATKMSLLTRLKMQKESDIQTRMIEASRAGPLALLEALSPALNAGTAGLQGAQGIANTLTNMGNLAGERGTNQTEMINNALAMLGSVFGNKSAKNPVGSMGSTGTTTGTTGQNFSFTPVKFNPTSNASGWVPNANPYQETMQSGMLNNQEQQALSVWGSLD